MWSKIKKMNEHEINYRSKKAFDKMRDTKMVVCGAGALGSNLISSLARQGFDKLSVIDMDRVEQKNVATQIYSLKDVGQKKVNALRGIIYQNNKKIIDIIDKELNKNNFLKLLDNYDLIIDVFDNWPSRRLVSDAGFSLKIPVIHAGMSDNGFSEIKWNDNYKIPENDHEQEDICDYPLAANLVYLTVAVLAEIITQFIIHSEMNNREITLRDINIHTL